MIPPLNFFEQACRMVDAAGRSVRPPLFIFIFIPAGDQRIPLHSFPVRNSANASWFAWILPARHHNVTIW
jgi:hypothetical protein